MQFSINLADKLDPLALYAALLSTVIFVWEIIKWVRQGPRLKGRANSGMKTFGMGYSDDKTYVVLNVTNVGTEKTTITHVAIYGFKRWWSWLRTRPDKAGVVKHSIAAYPIPYVLNVGEKFMSMCHQDDELEQWSRDYWLYAVIVHSFSDKPLLMRIKPIAKSEETAPRAAGD